MEGGAEKKGIWGLTFYPSKVVAGGELNNSTHAAEEGGGGLHITIWDSFNGV